MDEREPLLDEAHFAPIAKFADHSWSAKGNNFVSLRFWQVVEDVAPLFLRRAEAADKVAQSVMGEAHPPLRERVATDEEESELAQYVTVAEAVTFVARPEHLNASEEKPDPLTRCIDVLMDFWRAYRVSTGMHVKELTYEQIHPQVLWFTRPAFEEVESRPLPAGVVMLENRNFGFSPEPTFPSDEQAKVMQFMARQSIRDPFFLYRERRVEADMACWTTGLFADSIVQSAIAAEVLLDAVLGFAMWEEVLAGQLTMDDVAQALSADLMPRVKNEYSHRFKGNWSLGTGPVADWFTRIASVRGRVVHGGYRPDKYAAADALNALDALEKLVGNRLAARWQRYPRTAWIFLGDPGFERRGLHRRAAAWRDQATGSIHEWISDYVTWRKDVDSRVMRRRRA